MKYMTIVGTRPEFIQATALTQVIRREHEEILVNTGQHYDDNMSQVFFEDLNLPVPEFSLGIGSGSHAQQTASIMTQLETIIIQEEPDWVIVYGDTNSTLAAALVTAKLNLRLAHIEAGLRSFDRQMPEEVNRIITDHISQLLFSPTRAGVDNLAREGITEGVHLVGDVRVDILHQHLDAAKIRAPGLRKSIGLSPDQPFALTTIHRPANTDDKQRLSDIFDTLNTLGISVVLPIHPRLRKMLQSYYIHVGENVHIVEPLGFLDMMAMLHASEIVITDSGGLQKESYMMKRPTVTVRDSTEWIETVDAGWNRLCEPEQASFKAAVDAARGEPPAEHPDLYGQPGVSERILDILLKA